MNPTGTQIEDRGQIVFLNEKITKREMKKGCPEFFTKQTADEILTVYRGCLIVQELEKTYIYPFDTRTNNMLFMNGVPQELTLVQAKIYVDKKIEKGTDLKLLFQEVEVSLRVTVKMAVTHKDDEIVHIDPVNVTAVETTECEEFLYAKEFVYQSALTKAAQEFREHLRRTGKVRT
jgi:hypothetical protein